MSGTETGASFSIKPGREIETEVSYVPGQSGKCVLAEHTGSKKAEAKLQVM